MNATILTINLTEITGRECLNIASMLVALAKEKNSFPALSTDPPGFDGFAATDAERAAVKANKTTIGRSHNAY